MFPLLGAPALGSGSFLNIGTKGGAMTAVNDVAMATDANGVTTFAWLEYINPYDQLHLQDLDNANAWVGSPARSTSPPTDRNEGQVELGVDGDGTRHVAYSVGEKVFVRKRTAQGAWTTEVEVSPPNGYQVSELKLFVAAGGEAVLLWRQETSGVDLWGIRYTPGSTAGTGTWSPAQRLTDPSLGSITAYDADIDPNGHCYILMIQQGPLRSLEF
jgi:hypothetical protein